MGLKEDLLGVPLCARLVFDGSSDTFFVNFEGFAIRRAEQIGEVEQAVASLLAPLGRKVAAVVNYDSFYINPDLTESYLEMVQSLVSRFYSQVTRYTTSAFLRMKLQDGLHRRGVAPHLYESREEALRALHGGGETACRPPMRSPDEPEWRS
jgi:propionate CoA-transferase